MLATLSDRSFDDPDWLFEIKWDGYRVQAIVADGKVRIYTRNGHDAATYFPRLLPAAGEVDRRRGGDPRRRGRRARPRRATRLLAPPGADLAVDRRAGARPVRSGRADVRGRLDRGRRADAEAAEAPLVYQVFDLLRHDGRSLLRVPLEERKRLLRAIVSDGSSVRFAAHVVGEGLAFYRAASTSDLEGIVAKHRRSRYEPGRRTGAWLKMKLRPEQALVVGGWTPGEGNAKELGALVVGVMDDGRLRFAGQGRLGLRRPGSAPAPRAARRARLGRAAVRPTTGCPGRPARRPLDRAAARDPGRARRLDAATGSSASRRSRGSTTDASRRP